MKIKINTLLIIVAILLSTSNVLANSICTEADKTSCSVCNPFWNPIDIVNGNSGGDTDHEIIYDITWVKIEGDTLKIYGWAFDKGTDNEGNNGIQIIASTATKESDIKESNSKQFEIKYATKGQNAEGKGLTYYDLSYWNCMRMTSNNKCISGATEKLRGGFEASLNLIEEDLPEGKYQVYLKVKNLNWVALTASTTSKDQSVDKYNASSKYDIDISGFGKNAQVITEYGRLHGDNGLICSSPVNKNISDPYYSYLKENQEYRINGNPVTACKGDCNSNEANYSQRLFPLSVSSGFPTIKIENSLQYAYYGPGTGIISYAPASWLRFSGHIQIKKIEKYGGGNDTGGGEKPEELKCKDAIEESECTSDETGTHAKFYESENLSSCTLDYGNNSGFELEGTKTTGNQFCTVSCKDDFDVFLPTFKNVTAGQSFDLNQSLEPNHYLPTIKAKRTCVTSKVDYNAFETKLKKAEDEMIKAYNIWKDYEAYYNETLKIDLDSKESYSHCHYCCVGTGCGDGKSCCPSCCGSYPTSYKPWHINQFEGPNGKIFKEDGKEECSGCHPCTNEPRSDLQNSAKKDMNDKEDIYLQKKSAYESLIAEYESCSNWTEEGKADFNFKPTVTFKYDNRDDKILNNGSYTYNYDKTNEVNKFLDTKTYTYWNTTNAMNETYTLNGSKTEAHVVSRRIVDCSSAGSTCKVNEDSIPHTFVTSTYIKRVEEIGYTYKLPQLYTTIPQGTLTKTKPSNNYIKLDENQVPININTNSGLYDYSFEITEFTDTTRIKSQNGSLRETKENKENLDKRITALLNEGREYVCEYFVENDIYIPNQGNDSGKINYFYRTVDPSNINPNAPARMLGYNWSNKVGTEVQKDIQASGTDYSALTSKDKFTFVLTPAIMEKIRDYNKEQNINGGYINWSKMSCEGKADEIKASGELKYYCKSEFLTCLTGGGNANDCAKIFGANTLNNYNKLTNYDDIALNDNRDILLEKMNDLFD